MFSWAADWHKLSYTVQPAASEAQSAKLLIYFWKVFLFCLFTPLFYSIWVHQQNFVQSDYPTAVNILKAERDVRHNTETLWTWTLGKQVDPLLKLIQITRNNREVTVRTFRWICCLGGQLFCTDIPARSLSRGVLIFYSQHMAVYSSLQWWNEVLQTICYDIRRIEVSACIYQVCPTCPIAPRG